MLLSPWSKQRPLWVWLCTAPVSILPSTAAGPSSTRLLICRNSSGSSPPTTVKPKPRRLFFSLVLIKVPFSSAGFRVKNGFPPAEQSSFSCFSTNIQLAKSQWDGSIMKRTLGRVLLSTQLKNVILKSLITALITNIADCIVEIHTQHHSTEVWVEKKRIMTLW